MSFVHFSIQFLLFFPPCVKKPPSIRDISPSSVIHVENIFSRFVSCLLMLLALFLTEWKHNFTQVQLINFFMKKKTCILVYMQE